MLHNILRAAAGRAVDMAPDFMDFTEVDPANYIVVNSASSVSAVDIPRDTDAYLYKDYGAGHFADFVADFTLDVTDFKTGDLGNPIVRVMVFGNSVDDAWNIPDQVSVTLYDYTSNLEVFLEVYEGGVRSTVSLNTNVPKALYYCRLDCTGGTAALKLATSEANRNGGVWAYEGSQALPAGAYRYYYPIASVNVSASGTCSATVYDVTIS